MNSLLTIITRCFRQLLLCLCFIPFTFGDNILIEKYLLLENEKFFTYYPNIAIPINNHHNQQDLESIEFPLIQFQDKIDNNNINITNIHTLLLSDSRNNISIMTINGDEMVCLLQLNTYLVDDELSYQNCTISMKFQIKNCFQVHQISTALLLILCLKDPKTIILQLQNFDNQVINKHEFKFNNEINNCKINSFYKDNCIIIYQTNCYETQLLIFQIEKEEIIPFYNDSFKSFLQLQNSSNQELGQLLLVQICLSKTSIFIFQNQIFRCENLVLNCYRIKDYSKQSIILKAFDYCYKGEILEITHNGQWAFKNQILNISINEYVDSFLIKNKLMVQSKQVLQIYFSSNLSNKLDIQAQSIIPIDELPYFALLTIQGEVQIYKLNNQEFFFSNKNSQSLQLLISLPLDFYLTQTNIKMITAEIYSQQNPQFLINTNPVDYLSGVLTNRICIKINQFQESIPFKIQNIQKNQKDIKYETYNNVYPCKINSKMSFYNIWLIEGLDFKQILILQQQSRLQICICYEGKLINKFQIPLHENYIEIIINQESLFLCIIYLQEFKFYQFIGENLVQKTIVIEEKINKTMFHNNRILLLLDNCKIMKLDFESINQPLLYIHFNDYICTKIQFIINPQLIITFDSILLLLKNKIKLILTIPQKILQVVIFNNHYISSDFSQFLIFYEHQQSVFISLYFSNLFQVAKLYDLPLYEYQIKIPLSFEYQESFLMILAQNNQSDNFILIYNCSSLSLKSLVQIIKVDNNNQYFGFINVKLDFFYFQNGSIQMQNINSICFKFEDQVETQKSFIEFSTLNLALVTSLPINTNQYNINIKQYFLNIKQSLILLKDEFIQIDKDGYLDLTNIFGQINQINILDNGLFQIINPFILSSQNENIQCILYTNYLCIKSDFTIQFIHLNYTQQFQIAPLTNNLCKIFYDQMINAYHIFDEIEYLITKKINIIKLQFQQSSENGKIIINQTIQTTILDQFLYGNIIDILKVNGLVIITYDVHERYLLFLETQHQYQFKLKSSFVYFTLDAYFINNYTYLFMFANNFQLELIIPSFNYKNELFEQTNLFQAKLNISQLFKELSINQNYLKLIQLKIISVDFIENLLKAKAFLFFQQYLTLCVELHFDLNQQILLQSYISSVYRITELQEFKALLYLDDNFMIIKVENQLNSSLLFYDLSLLQYKTDIDYFYKCENENYTAIEKFNQTHHVITSLQNGIFQVNFVQLSKYQIKCLNECNFMPTLQLQNDFTSLNISIFELNNKQSSRYREIVIVICFHFILFYLIRGKKIKNGQMIK